MILIPYFIEKNDRWVTLGIFLSSGGREPWYIESKEKDKGILKMLKDNGFPLVILERLEGIVLAKLDYNKLDLHSFYTWDEVDPETSDHDVWRIIQIPVSLWSCSVFKDDFIKKCKLPSGMDILFNKV